MTVTKNSENIFYNLSLRLIWCYLFAFDFSYDRKLCIYDSYAYPGKKGLKLVTW